MKRASMRLTITRSMTGIVTRLMTGIVLAVSVAVISIPGAATAATGPNQVCRSEVYTSFQLGPEGWQSASFVYGFTPHIVGYGWQSYSDIVTSATAAAVSFAVQYGETIQVGMRNDSDYAKSFLGYFFVTYQANAGSC